jgi:hypothetical protein
MLYNIDLPRLKKKELNLTLCIQDSNKFMKISKSFPLCLLPKIDTLCQSIIKYMTMSLVEKCGTQSCNIMTALFLLNLNSLNSQHLISIDNIKLQLVLKYLY